MLGSLDFVYVPTADVDTTARHYVEVLDARLEWRVRAMGTTVAAIRVAQQGPLILLAGHLEGDIPSSSTASTTTTRQSPHFAPRPSRSSSSSRSRTGRAPPSAPTAANASRSTS